MAESDSETSHRILKDIAACDERIANFWIDIGRNEKDKAILRRDKRIARRDQSILDLKYRIKALEAEIAMANPETIKGYFLKIFQLLFNGR